MKYFNRWFVLLIKHHIHKRMEQQPIFRFKLNEDIINQFIIENVNKYELIDIKYTDKSCLIIYKLL